MKRALVALLALVALVGAGCSEDKKVGSDELLQFNESATTTTGAPGAGGPATTAVATTVKVQATAPPTTKPSAAKAATPASTDFQLSITANGFDPDNFVVKVGQRVVFTNKDSGRAHSWVANDGTWDSGPLPPGEQFVYVANKAGVFDFKDEEVPFLIGRMEVRA
jgi:plastocyanin